MRHLPGIRLALAALALPIAPTGSPAALFRWGPLGHRIVAQIALDRLTPTAAAETRRLLGGQNITDVASWADEQRQVLGPSFSPWHYVDVEVTDSAYVAARDCKADACVVGALDKEMRILGDRSEPDSTRAVALKWVVHLIGDLHQPLHAGERGDKGGNDVKVTLNGRLTNLHSIWDSGLLLSYNESEQQLEDEIRVMIGQQPDIAAIAGGTDVDWVNESHDISRDYVYKKLPNSLVISQEYIDGAKPIILNQLMKGGVRLAAVLNRELN